MKKIALISGITGQDGAYLAEFLLKKAKKEAAKNDTNYLISYYSIPEYSELTLQFTKNKARQFYESGFTIRGWGRELLLRKLGEEEADRVFPQMRGQVIKDGKTTKLIEKIALELIEMKNWTTETEILTYLLEEADENKTMCEKRVKRVVPEMLDKYGLRKVRLNKKLKEELNVTTEHYPNIIYREVLDKAVCVEVNK